MKRTSIQTQFGNAAAFPGYLCLQVHPSSNPRKPRCHGGTGTEKHAP